MTVQNFSLTLSVLSAKTMFKRTGSTMFGVFNLRVASGVNAVPQLPSMLGPAVHRGKDTTHKTLKTMCGPNNLTFRGPAPSVVDNLFCFQYSDTALYTQLLYFSRLFDFDHAVKNAKTGQYFE